MDCIYPKRGWTGYVIDIFTMGGYTVYTQNEYIKCKLNVK